MMWTVTADGSPTGQITPRETRPLYDRDEHPTVEATAIAWDQEAQIVGADGRAHLTTRYGVTDRFFEVLRPRMTLGRGFERGETPGVVVISYSTWRDLFGSDPNVIGRTVQLDPIPCRVVGVAPEGFEFPESAGYWYLMQLGTGFDRIRGYEAYVRLRPNRSREQLQADLNALSRDLGPDPATGQPVRLVAQPLLEHVVGDLGATVTILFAATAVLLLIACINVTNLLLSRVTARVRELALREAVGAGRWRIVRQVLTETLVLAATGGLLGLALAWAGIRLFPWLVPLDLPRIDTVAVDRTVLLFTVASTALVGLLAAVAPICRLARSDIAILVNESGRGIPGGGRTRLFSVFVVAEVGLAVLLVIGAGLLVRSYANLQSTDPGFNPDRMLTFSMNVPGRVDSELVKVGEGRPPVRRASYRPVANFFRELSQRVKGLPGVEALATTSSLPLKRIQYDSSPAFHIMGSGALTPENALIAVNRSVSPEFFPAMQIRVLKGRNFEPSDGRGTPGVAIVNEAFARQFFPGQDPLQQRIRYQDTATINQLFERTAQEFEIVGIVEDVKYTSMAEPAVPSIYLSSEQWIYRRLTVVVRTALENPDSLVPAIRREIESIDPLLTADFALYNPIVRASTARERLGMTLLVSFGIMSLVLAAIGIYGVMSYSVAQRRGEIAVRLALGASAGQVLASVLRRGVALALAGIILGGLSAVALRRMLASQLYEVSPLDPRVYVSVPILLLSVAVLATLLPASRARKVDPADMLRMK
jgi:putative ABC transport system permease protein